MSTCSDTHHQRKRVRWPRYVVVCSLPSVPTLHDQARTYTQKIKMQKFLTTYGSLNCVQYLHFVVINIRYISVSISSLLWILTYCVCLNLKVVNELVEHWKPSVYTYLTLRGAGTVTRTDPTCMSDTKAVEGQYSVHSGWDGRHESFTVLHEAPWSTEYSKSTSVKANIQEFISVHTHTHTHILYIYIRPTF